LQTGGLGLQGSGGGGLQGCGAGAGVLQDGLEQLSLIICDSSIAITSSAITNVVKAVKLNKNSLLIVCFSYL
jgi:hypothetical protein